MSDIISDNCLWFISENYCLLLRHFCMELVYKIPRQHQFVKLKLEEEKISNCEADRSNPSSPAFTGIIVHLWRIWSWHPRLRAGEAGLEDGWGMSWGLSHWWEEATLDWQLWSSGALVELSSQPHDGSDGLWTVVSLMIISVPHPTPHTHHFSRTVMTRRQQRRPGTAWTGRWWAWWASSSERWASGGAACVSLERDLSSS